MTHAETRTDKIVAYHLFTCFTEAYGYEGPQREDPSLDPELAAWTVDDDKFVVVETECGHFCLTTPDGLSDVCVTRMEGEEMWSLAERLITLIQVF